MKKRRALVCPLSLARCGVSLFRGRKEREKKSQRQKKESGRPNFTNSQTDIGYMGEVGTAAVHSRRGRDVSEWQKQAWTVCCPSALLADETTSGRRCQDIWVRRMLVLREEWHNLSSSPLCLKPLVIYFLTINNGDGQQGWETLPKAKPNWTLGNLLKPPDALLWSVEALHFTPPRLIRQDRSTILQSLTDHVCLCCVNECGCFVDWVIKACELIRTLQSCFVPIYKSFVQFWPD